MTIGGIGIVAGTRNANGANIANTTTVIVTGDNS
jgi:hypothetical protein